jgi:hypothetical protein
MPTRKKVTLAKTSRNGTPPSQKRAVPTKARKKKYRAPRIEVYGTLEEITPRARTFFEELD